MDKIRVSAKTKDEAITKALIQLGITSDRLDYTVLVEGKSKNKKNYLSGRTDGNIIIEVPGDESLIGRFLEVRVDKFTNLLEGTIV